jgi:glycosyltransferase involved in cell wall biosynthesis
LLKLLILTPTRNRLHFLRENIESVRMSSLAPLEIELVQALHDCGSDDGTAAWLESLRGDPCLRITLSPRPMPPGQARNIAAASAPGDFIMPLDDDDLLLQRTAHHFLHALSTEEARWAVADFLSIDKEGRYIPGRDYYAWRFGSADEMLQAIFSGKHYLQGNVCFSRGLFDQVGGYAEDMETAEDLELYTRFVLEAGLPAYVPAASHLHRLHDLNASRSVDKDRYNRDMSDIYERHRSKLEARGIRLELIP